MRNIKHLVLTALLVALQVVGPVAFAADTSVATLNISGNVPTVFSVTARGYPGDLDLSGDVAVANRLLGIFHFKYNVDVASMTLASTQPDGVPSTGGAGTGYSFGAAFTLKFSACTSIDAVYEANWNPLPVADGGLELGGGIDIKDAAATSSLTAGIEEDCNLTASWGGNASNLPLAGKYSLAMTLTMISI